MPDSKEAPKDLPVAQASKRIVRAIFIVGFLIAFVLWRQDLARSSPTYEECRNFLGMMDAQCQGNLAAKRLLR